jgi:DNA-directed RNA polymerase specialized sigma24 family protein
MLKQDNLRKQVKLLKATQGISYKEIAEILEIK